MEIILRLGLYLKSVLKKLKMIPPTFKIAVSFFFLLLCTLGCRQEESAQAKFVAFAQQYGENKKSWLINKVRKSSWKIHYGFADNNNCVGVFGSAELAQLTAALTRVTRVWLQALEHRGNIVQSFNYELLDTKDVIFDRGRSYERKFGYGLLGRGKPDLAIIFYCREGRSFAQRKGNPPELHIMQRRGLSKDSMTKQRRYRMTTVLHEIGHGFGLGDTYVDAEGEKARYNISDGGVAKTVGTQPLSVMNQHYLIGIDPDNAEPKIGSDDRAGLNWLYDFHHRKSIRQNNCPEDYVYERSTKGCAPRYPLIFMVRQLGLEAVIKFLRDDPSIDLNQQDGLGNTALHYAANLSAQHGRELYDLLIKHGANDTIKNKSNETARELLADRVSASSKAFIATIFAAARRARQQNTTPQQQQREDLTRAVMYALVRKFFADTSNDVNMQDAIGNTLLHYVAIHGHLKLLPLLLQQDDIDINAQARVNEETALHKAARYGQPEVAAALLNRADIDSSIKDTWGRTALSRALYERFRASNKGKTELAAKIRDVAELIRDHERDTASGTAPPAGMNNSSDNTCGNPASPPMQGERGSG